MAERYRQQRQRNQCSPGHQRRSAGVWIRRLDPQTATAYQQDADGIALTPADVDVMDGIVKRPCAIS